MLFSQAALRGFTGSFEMSVFQTLSAGNIGQPGAPGTVVPAASTAACACVPGLALAGRAARLRAARGAALACRGVAACACATGLALVGWPAAAGATVVLQAASSASGSAAAVAVIAAAAGRDLRGARGARELSRNLCIAEHPGTAARPGSGIPGYTGSIPDHPPAPPDRDELGTAVSAGLLIMTAHVR